MMAWVIVSRFSLVIHDAQIDASFFGYWWPISKIWKIKSRVRGEDYLQNNVRVQSNEHSRLSCHSGLFTAPPETFFLIQIERLGPALITALWFVSWKTAYLVPSLYDKDMETTNAKTRPRIVGGWRTGKRIEHPSWQGIRPSM